MFIPQMQYHEFMPPTNAIPYIDEHIHIFSLFNKQISRVKQAKQAKHKNMTKLIVVAFVATFVAIVAIPAVAESNTDLPEIPNAFEAKTAFVVLNTTLAQCTEVMRDAYLSDEVLDTIAECCGTTSDMLAHVVSAMRREVALPIDIAELATSAAKYTAVCIVQAKDASNPAVPPINIAMTKTLLNVVRTMAMKDSVEYNEAAVEYNSTQLDDGAW